MKEKSSAVLTSGEAHNEAMSLSMESVVASLTEILDASTVAALSGVQETRAVQQWIAGTRQPQRPHVLRFALQMALMISTVSSRELARAWFHGSNPQLSDLTPVAMLRDQPLETVQVPLMIAARSFAARRAG
jgi:hypothetical protein